MTTTRKRNVHDVLEVLKSKGDGAKTVLIRVDFNVPMDANGTITDDSRIRGALATIKVVLDSHNNALLVSHMGRPKLVQKGGDDKDTLKERKDLSLKPIAEHLSKLLEKPVLFGEDCLKSQDTVKDLPAEGGGVCLLENLRFYKAEEKNEKSFSKTLAAYADGYVNDAFGTAHRAHASTAGVPSIMPKEVCGIGCLVASELEYLDFSSTSKTEKIAAIIGGSKVSTKLPVIQGLLGSVQILVLGGGLAFTFLKAQGVDVGDSLLEETMIDTAKDILAQAEKEGKQIFLPLDAVCSKKFPSSPMDLKDTKTFDLVPGGGIPSGWMGLDVGPKTVALFDKVLSETTKICFNGPMGVFEVVPFDIGSRGLVDTLCAVTKKGTITVVGGGDSVAALKAFGKFDDVSYVSTGGGATLELLAGDKLPGVEVIEDISA
jgi:phosphoglycerate kinase